MTKEARFKNLLDGYNSRKEDADKRYRELIDIAKLDDEVDIAKVLDAGAWHAQWLHELENAFWHDVLTLLGKEGEQ